MITELIILTDRRLFTHTPFSLINHYSKKRLLIQLLKTVFDKEV